jgi:protocatechuate 3,4-dioxygenase beta subunit
MDTSTCTPLNNAFVEIWHGEVPDASKTALFLTTIPLPANATGWYGAYNEPSFNASESWLRGGWYTDSNGIAELTTIYPGYYTGRTPHIHIMVRTNWTESTNGFVQS